MMMTKTANPRDLPKSTRPVAALHQGGLRVRAIADRRSWGILRSHFSARATQKSKPPMEAAGAVDAKNAPTAPWKTAQNAVSHSYHRPHHRQQSVTHVPGLLCYLSSRLLIARLILVPAVEGASVGSAFQDTLQSVSPSQTLRVRRPSTALFLRGA
jgi:hypothetical protein